MDKDGLFALWARYMHRADLGADLETTYLLTWQMIVDAWAGTPLPYELPEEWLQNSSKEWVHGGLAQLHELAQDNDGVAREMDLFRRAIDDHQRRHSIDTCTAPQMASPWGAS